MFQWFIRKCIPLSFAKDELPFLSKWVQKKVSQSQVLQEEKRKYQTHRSHFQLLHDHTLKQENFEDYWQELESKLKKESTENKKEAISSPPKVSYTGLFLPRFGFAFAIFIAAIIFVQPGIFEMENSRTQNSTLTINFPIWNNLKEKNTRLDELVPIDVHIKNMNIDVKDQNYQLDQVIQCKFESATF